MSDRSSMEAALAKVTAALPAAEDRPGQRQMAVAVGAAITGHRHLVVQAGTGTGKTMAYLVPAVLSGQRVVIATATKALQDQLAAKDLPFLAEHLGEPFEWAILKGRSNYICMQRVRELQSASTGQLEFEEMAPQTKVDIRRLVEWSGTTKTGDQADLSWSPADRSWQSVSVSSDECPGGKRCPMGQVCFAELARSRAEFADVLVVNQHLYGMHVAGGGALLPEHEVVVIDEAHQLEDIMSDTVGVQIGPGRFTNLAAIVRRVIEDPVLIGELTESAPAVREALSPHSGERFGDELPDGVREALLTARQRIDKAQSALREIDTDVPEAQQRKIRAQQVATRVQEHIDVALGAHDGYVAFVSGSGEQPRLEIAPLDVGPVLAKAVWSQRTAVLTSATLPPAISHRAGLADDTFTQIDVGSPFDYGSNALLYCAMHLPDPRAAEFATCVHDELVALINAAGGRTLALFTSWKAMDSAAAAVRAQVDVPVLTQRDFPKTALVKKFSEDESACLFATAGFFQGVDIPGRTLSLVTIDRIPFPRPDDPLLSARRELLGATAFGEIDLPRAATMLAQATGRLIRNATDRGVVAVFDRRLGRASYRWQIISALPPMRRSKDRAEVESFLRDITA
ncbi:MAG TPA: ATP-dependent DNA helicase [Ilumatobacteraceae bacterium]